MKMLLPLLLIFITACSNSSESTSSTKTTSPNAEAIPKMETEELDWQKLYDESEQETLTHYQEQLGNIDQKKYEDLSAAQFINLLLSETEEGVVRTVQPGDPQKLQLENGAVLVIVQEEKIPDDSLAGEIRFFKLRKDNATWDLAAVSAVWKCYAGRGHTNYSTLPCN